jgi:hypothetical protein
MLSDRAFMALRDLDEGARLNAIHSVARELIAAGLCLDDFGYLRLTEAGRQVSRGKLPRSLQIQDGNVADLSYRIDPMANPEVARNQMSTPPAMPAPSPSPSPSPLEQLKEVTLDLALPPAKEPAADDYTKGLRAAGVATGITGISVDPKWVMEFIKCYVSIG